MNIFKQYNTALPVSIDIVVVFPAPLCPSSAVICPSYILHETLLTAILLLPNRLLKFLIIIPGVSPAGSGSNPGWSSHNSSPLIAELIQFESLLPLLYQVLS